MPNLKPYKLKTEAGEIYSINPAPENKGANWEIFIGEDTYTGLFPETKDAVLETVSKISGAKKSEITEV